MTVIDSLLEHFGEPLASPPAPAKPKGGKGSKVKPRNRHAKLSSLTDAALRARLKSSSGSTPAERRAAAALLQHRRDATEAHTAKAAAKSGAPAEGGKGDAGDAGSKVEKAEPAAKLSEGFAPAPAPANTPQQTLAAAPAQIAAAKAATDAWDASKHPRSAGGKFGVSGAAKASTSSSSSTRKSATASDASTTLYKAGATGSTVEAIQRQLGIPVTGTYGARTEAAVSAYQKAHGLAVDGQVGRQTLAALDGQAGGKVAPGAIMSPARALARLDRQRAKVQAEGAVGRRYLKTHGNVGGGELI